MWRPPAWVGIGWTTATAVAVVVGQARVVEPAEVRCPEVLGVGVETNVAFCDVLIQSVPELGARVVLPPRRGEAVVSFNLHNRHVYSEADVQAGRAFAEYTAEVAVATMTGEVLSRRFIRSEFRAADDLVDRVTGGAGPAGLKAVAPTGAERVFVTVPEGLDEIAIVGQALSVRRVEGRDELRMVGRAIAVISNVEVAYQPR